MDKRLAPTTGQTATAAGVRPLTDLRPSEVGRVARLADEHDGVARLKSLGVCQGRSIELVKAGDPLIVRVLGVRVGLSARLASSVYVEAV